MKESHVESNDRMCIFGGWTCELTDKTLMKKANFIKYLSYTHEKQDWLEINLCQFVDFTFVDFTVTFFFPRTDQADLVILHQYGVYMHWNCA